MKFIQRLNSLFVLLPLALIVLAFALLNRSPVPVDLFIATVNTLPLFVWVLGALAVGVFLGLGISWLSAGKVRRRARTGERKARALEGEVAEMRQGTDAPGRGRGTSSESPDRRRLAIRSRAAAGDQ